VIGLEARPAAIHMAVDEAIAEEIASAVSPPTIRFYRWKPGAVSIGCFQCLEDEVDRDACMARGVDIVRRRTGGGAVYHDPEGEITYSVIAPESCYQADIRASYREICGSIIAGLATLGIEASFRPVNDVVVGSRKISGSAQTRRHGVLTQHGTILYRLDRDTMFTLLRPSAKKLEDKPALSFHDSVTSASEEGCTSLDQLDKALQSGFLSGKEWAYGTLSEAEERRVGTLADKYRSLEWTASR
jgi:lipoate-protein ligase A